MAKEVETGMMYINKLSRLDCAADRRPARRAPLHRLRLPRSQQPGLAPDPVRLLLRPGSAGIVGSIGTVGDALDNALMESTIGLYKTELIHRHRSFTGRADLEHA